MSSIHKGHRERLRNRFIETEGEGFLGMTLSNFYYFI